MTSFASITQKKRELDGLRKTLRPGGLEGLDHSQRIDITYSSNAIEGNTLTAGETALVLEKGITISGKPLKDHLEAVDHARAYDWVMEVASHTGQPLAEIDLRNLHRLVVAKSNPDIAGRYADRARFVNTNAGVHNFPSPSDVPMLMQDFAGWLAAAKDTPQNAFAAHRRFVGIHPFNDGNGRTARLLMNLILLRGGYPPIAVRPDDRPIYLSALEIEQASGDHAAFDHLLLRSLDQTLDTYIAAARQAQASDEATKIVPLRK